MPAPSDSWEVLIHDRGRDGAVSYREPSGELRCYWEYGGGDVIAIVSVGQEDHWRSHAPWAVGRHEVILSRIAREVIRQRVPTGRADYDERLAALHFRSREAPLPPGERTITGAPPPKPSSSTRKRPGLMIVIGIIAALGLAALLIGRTFLTVRTTGAPWGQSVRSGDAVVTMITRLEPYVPTLHRNPANDRYTVGLLIHSASDAGRGRFVEVATGRRGSDLNQAKLGVVDGSRVWFVAGSPGVYDVRTERVDHRPAGQPPARPFVPADLATGRDALRLMLIDPGSPPRLGSVVLPGGEGMHQAGFLRRERQGEILRVADDDVLLLFESKPYRAGTVMVARIRADGTRVWTLDTGIGELREVFPDPAYPALIGDRPREPGKVPEPILVVVDVGAGRVTTRSLWLE